jgi:AcrR family transcriptional regulator
VLRKVNQRGDVRTDARENRERLLGAARRLLRQRGTEASLREVAREARVGIGTLYRHFPTREALVEAALSAEFDALAGEGRQLEAAGEPGQVLLEWLREFAALTGAYEGLPSSVLTALGDPASPLHHSCLALRRRAAALLTRAQRSGELRADLTVADLLSLTAGLAWAANRTPGGTPVDHLLALAFEGLSA